MAFKREWVQDWVAEHAPGEPVVSYLVASTWTPVVVKGTFGGRPGSGVRSESLKLDGDARMQELIDDLDVDGSARVGPFVDSVFYALTDRRLLLGSRSGMRNRPKDLVHAAPLDGVQVVWFDQDESAGNRFRHLLVQWGDGR